LTAGQEAFDKLLPKLKAAQYLDLKDLPRTPRGPSESGRFNFFLPSLKGVSPADLALASTWLSHRDAKDWAALNMSGLSTAKTIDRWLLPHQVTSSVDHVAELRVIRRLVQATDKMSAALAWPTEAVRFSRLSESGIIPPFWVQEVRTAMADDDWLQAKMTLATLLEPSLPRTPANKRPKVPNHASVYGSGAVMGTGFISTIHSHRPHCMGLRWKKVDSPPAGGTQMINRNLVRLLRQNPATVTGETEWLSLGIARPQIDSFVRSSAEDKTFYCPIPEDARETSFLCTINAPNHLRLKASWTLPPRRATPVIPERTPGKARHLNSEPPLDLVLTESRGAELGQFHPGRKGSHTVPCVH